MRDIPEDPDDMAIVQAVIARGRSLGLKVIAEGIESAQQREFLAVQGCTRGQGFLFARPMPVEDFLAYLRLSEESDPLV